MEEKMATGEATGGWQLVTRRRSKPIATPTPITTFKPYLTSYADVVRKATPSSTIPQTITQSHKPTPFQPTATIEKSFYISTYTSTRLRFPPSPRYVRWKGRCFRCCRMGHSASRCKNPKKCGRCWGDGHVGTYCNKQQLNPGARPFSPATVSPPRTTRKIGEPSFSEVLQSPATVRGLPDNRPQKIVCFVDRDEEYYEKRRRLDKAVVMYNPELELI